MLNEFTFPDGSKGWFELVMTPAAGGVMVLSVDVTEQKRTEAKLRQSLIALGQADRRKDEMLTMLAHELRNPLAAIRSGMYVVEGSLPDGDQVVADAAAIVDRQLRHLSRLVDHLVDATRIVGGQTALTLERVDLSRIAREAVTDHGPGIEERGVTVEANVPATPVWVTGDETRLTQVLGNLLDNSGRFTPAGGKVMVHLGATDTHTVLRVSDNGVGIAIDAQPFVFEPLFQADSSMDRAAGGLGLGLTVAKALVERHQGTIVLSSDGVGRGTSIEIRIPRAPEPVVTEPAATETPGAARASRVLIIEDNADAARSLKMVVGMWGYDVSVAYSGPEGVDRARATRPQIVLCDVGLPGMDGYEVARQLRADGTTREARLIAITGYGQERDRSNALEAGFDAHFAKPVDPDRLKLQLES
jgi:signal transduction histidine kinase